MAVVEPLPVPVHHFWQCWSAEYLSHPLKFAKWNIPLPNLQVGDIVCLTGELIMSTKWSLACVAEIHPVIGESVRVVTARTSKGTYNLPITKVVP